VVFEKPTESWGSGVFMKEVGVDEEQTIQKWRMEKRLLVWVAERELVRMEWFAIPGSTRPSFRDPREYSQLVHTNTRTGSPKKERKSL